MALLEDGSALESQAFLASGFGQGIFVISWEGNDPVVPGSLVWVCGNRDGQMLGIVVVVVLESGLGRSRGCAVSLMRGS